MIRILFQDSSIYEFPTTCYWKNEADWDDIAQSTQYLLPSPVEGEEIPVSAFLIKLSRKGGGRLITIAGLIQWGDVLELKAKASNNPQMTVQIGGRPDITTIFARPAVKASLLKATKEQPSPDDWASVEVNFWVV